MGAGMPWVPACLAHRRREATHALRCCRAALLPPPYKDHASRRGRRGIARVSRCGRGTSRGHGRRWWCPRPPGRCGRGGASVKTLTQGVTSADRETRTRRLLHRRVLKPREDTARKHKPLGTLGASAEAGAQQGAAVGLRCGRRALKPLAPLAGAAGAGGSKSRRPRKPVRCRALPSCEPPNGRHHANENRDASEATSRGWNLPNRAQRKKVVKSCDRGSFVS